MHIFHGVGSAAAVDTMRLHLEVLLSMGVTTVRDMAGDARVLRRLAEEERAGAEVPRIFFSALFAGPQQFARDPRGAAASQGVPPGTAPWMRSVSDTTNVEAVIRDAKETGAAGIKLYADLGEETVERLAMEAKREGMRVWSHARIRPLPARRVVTTGVETVSHAHHFLDEIEPAEAARFRQAVDRDSTTQLASPRLREVFDAMAERGVIFDPTLSLYEREENGRLRVAGAIVRAARDAGVRILAGTDPSGEDTAEIPLVHRELELLVEYGGLTPMEALKAATCVAADALGIRQRLGSVSVGQLGDLVVLGSDPLERISNVRDIRLVIKGGSIIRKPSP
jgi:imidazolonepropionase-like amidohydrolase